MRIHILILGFKGLKLRSPSLQDKKSKENYCATSIVLTATSLHQSPHLSLSLKHQGRFSKDNVKTVATVARPNLKTDLTNGRAAINYRKSRSLLRAGYVLIWRWIVFALSVYNLYAYFNLPIKTTTSLGTRATFSLGDRCGEVVRPVLVLSVN